MTPSIIVILLLAGTLYNTIMTTFIAWAIDIEISKKNILRYAILSFILIALTLLFYLLIFD